MSVFDKTPRTTYHVLFAESNKRGITKCTDPKGTGCRGRGILIQKSLPWPNSSCSWLLAGNYQTSDQLGMFHLHLARRCLSSLSATLLGDAASQQRLIHQGFGPSENEINRNRAKYVKSHFSSGLFHTNV